LGFGVWGLGFRRTGADSVLVSDEVGVIIIYIYIYIYTHTHTYGCP